jgi:hypothetical protein
MAKRPSRYERVVDEGGLVACQRSGRTIAYEACLGCPWFRRLGERNGFRFVRCDMPPLARLYPVGI